MSDPLNRLNNVLEKTQRYIAKVETLNNNGTTTVKHSNGSKEVVIGGNVSAGSVYISDGVVIGKAADLIHVEIEV